MQDEEKYKGVEEGKKRGRMDDKAGGRGGREKVVEKEINAIDSGIIYNSSP